MTKKVGKYEIHKTLGEGTFGKVKKALNTENQEWVAIKVLDKEKIQKQNMGAQVKKEISIMKLVRHPHVVQLKEVLASRTKIFIVLELVTGGELFDLIVSEGRFKEKTARFYFQQLVVGSQYCHSKGVCHRDLKPENLLLDEKGNLKISDFGLSALYEQNAGETDRATLLHTTCGTPNYVAPEVLADKGYDGAIADTWSIGVILFVFLAGFLPFDEPTMSALFRKIQKAEFSYPTWFTDEVKDLLNHILIIDPKKRWTLNQIREHSWWKKDGPYASNAVEVEIPLAVADSTDIAFGTAGGDGGANDDAMSVGSDNGGSKSAKGGKASKGDEKMEMSSPKPGAKASSGAAATSSSATSGSTGASAVDDIDDGDDGDDGDGLTGNKVNAFDLINMCTGTAIGRMFQSDAEKAVHRTKIFVSSKQNKDIMTLIEGQLKTIPGFQSLNVYKDQFKARGVFDLGKGHIHLKIAIKIASESPRVCLVLIKRGRGDLISFGEINSRLGPIGTIIA